MIIFKPKQIAGEKNFTCTVLFGAGLIGKAIALKLLHNGNYTPVCISSKWRKPENLDLHREGLHDVFKFCSAGKPLEVIWSAGSTGFDINADQAKEELDCFVDHLKMINDIARHNHNTVNFRLISSAGGLFEGQRLVGLDSSPEPQRHYGCLKLDMEKKLLSHEFNFSQILRPTSVFGYISSCQRQGLITTLIENGLKGRVTPIFGNFGTLRDFIFTEDIADFIAGEILFRNQKKGKEVVLLSSGKPSTIGEIIVMVEKVLGRKLFLQCSLNPTNLAHITCRPQVYSRGVQTTPLPVAINLIYQNYQPNGSAMRSYL